jgi:hypothetical protein
MRTDIDVRAIQVRMSEIQPTKTRKRVGAVLLSDRIDTSNLEHDGVVSTAPLTYKFGVDGFVTLFRYGVAVFMALSAPEEEQESAVRLNFSEAVFIALAERPGVAVEAANADQA